MTAAAPQPGGSSSAPGAPPAGRPDGALDAVRAAYTELFGTVPAGIEHRLALAGRAGRTDSVLAIEALRQALIMDNPLGRQTSQLVHFGQVVALGEGGPARQHARAARRAGASLAQLLGVVELALITSGMPAYGLGIEILTEMASEESGGTPAAGPAGS